MSRPLIFAIIAIDIQYRVGEKWELRKLSRRYSSRRSFACFNCCVFCLGLLARAENVSRHCYWNFQECLTFEVMDRCSGSFIPLYLVTKLIRVEDFESEISHANVIC